MYEQVEKPKENKSRAVANSIVQEKNYEKQGVGFVDNRPEAILQRKKQRMTNGTSQVMRNLPDISLADITGANALQMKAFDITEIVSSAQSQQNTFQLKGVIQRMVPNNLDENTEVFVNRSTSRQFHGSPATIRGKGPLSNEYVIEVSGQLLIARCDQLVLNSRELGSVIEADMDTVCRTPPEKLLAHVRHFVNEMIKPKKPFVVGGSFAVLLHAFAAGGSARTPRDIDIILEAEDFSSYLKPKKTTLTVWGIPLELHKNGAFVQTDVTEQKAGVADKNKLLAKELIKLLGQNVLFRSVFPLPGTKITDTAHEVLEKIESKNNEIMSKGESEEMSDSHKRVWMKTIVDIRTLVASGATLEAYKNETDPW